MTLHLSGWYMDTLGSDNKVLDLGRLEVRPRVSEKDLEKQYDEFVSRLGTINDSFENQDAFKKACEEAAGEKRPKLIPRTPRYSGLFGLVQLDPFGFMNPEKRRLNDRYFVAGHCMVRVNGKATELEKKAIVNPKFQKDLEGRFTQYPGYEGIIEVPNDRTLPETKAVTFHEGLHYIIARYQASTGRRFVDGSNLPDRDMVIGEQILNERVVEILTDRLLTHDQDALFESRWPRYSIGSGVNPGFMLASGISTGGIIFASVVISPYLLPLVVVPKVVAAVVKQKHKESKREELLQPVEYPKLKI